VNNPSQARDLPCVHEEHITFGQEESGPEEPGLLFLLSEAMNTARSSPVQVEVEVEAEHAEARALLERILASRHFVKSGLLSRFLRYICERSLTGGGHALTEHHIGVHVFGRPEDYDCSADNIVRNYARQLRNRLEDYYRWEGQSELLRLEVPRGGYKPIFLPLTMDSIPGVAEDHAALFTTPGIASKPSTRSQPWAMVVLSAVIIALLVVVLVLRSRARPVSVVSSPMHAFWASIFHADRDTVIVTADSGFGTLQDVLGRRLSLADYTSLQLGNLSLASPEKYITKDLASQRYTSMTDLETAVALSHLPEVVPSRLTIRFARDLRMEDLKDDNVVLLGSAYTNPWTELFEKNLAFELVEDAGAHSWKVVNRHPAPGEESSYQGERDGASHKTYARIAWVPNLDDTGHILMLQGLDMAGTQAAAQALLHSTALMDVWRQSNACNTPDASFEVLLGTTSISSNAGTIHVLATRHSC
jgi:hypothetical protein